MNIKQIRELARIAAQYSLTALSIDEGETHIHIERGAVAAQELESAAPARQPVLPSAAEPVRGSGVDFNHAFEVKSPLVGVFYAANSPDDKPFVQVGSRVNKGDVLGIIEAMKLMNELTADRDGEVVDVCVNNGDVVEFGQTLFKMC